jgi:hypothetical protein
MSDLKLWLISQEVNNDWDTYDSAVVVAPDERSAKSRHPGGDYTWKDGAWTTPSGYASSYSSWAAPGDVTAQYIGEAAPDLLMGEVICASFNAG